MIIDGDERYTQLVDRAAVLQFLRDHHMSERRIKRLHITFQERIHPSFPVSMFHRVADRKGQVWGMYIVSRVYLATYYVPKWGYSELNTTLVHELTHACTVWLIVCSLAITAGIEYIAWLGLQYLAAHVATMGISLLLVRIVELLVFAIVTILCVSQRGRNLLPHEVWARHIEKQHAYMLLRPEREGK
jgi:hypothetical protein